MKELKPLTEAKAAKVAAQLANVGANLAQVKSEMRGSIKSRLLSLLTFDTGETHVMGFLSLSCSERRNGSGRPEQGAGAAAASAVANL